MKMTKLATMKRHKNIQLYDELMFHLWEVTTGGAVSKREAFVGAKLFARFLLSEIEHKNGLDRAGKTTVVSRGRAISNSKLNAWAWNIMDDCHHHRVPPPRELLDVLYLQLNCSHLTNKRGKPTSRQKGEALLNRRNSGEQLSLSEIARLVGVNKTTVKTWSDELPNRKIDYDELRKLRELTNLIDFFPVRYRTPRK